MEDHGPTLSSMRLAAASALDARCPSASLHPHGQHHAMYALHDDLHHVDRFAPQLLASSLVCSPEIQNTCIVS